MTERGAGGALGSPPGEVDGIGLLPLRWRDVELDAGTARIRRSAGMVRNAGEGAEVIEGVTKSGKPRAVDLDPATVALLRDAAASAGRWRCS